MDAWAAVGPIPGEAESSGEPAVSRPPDPRVSAAEQVLRRMPAEQLAAELQRRGWILAEP